MREEKQGLGNPQTGQRPLRQPPKSRVDYIPSSEMAFHGKASSLLLIDIKNLMLNEKAV